MPSQFCTDRLNEASAAARRGDGQAAIRAVRHAYREGSDEDRAIIKQAAEQVANDLKKKK